MANRCSGQMPVVSCVANTSITRSPRLAPRPVSQNGADKGALSYHAETLPPRPSAFLLPFSSYRSSSIVYFSFFFVFVLVGIRRERTASPFIRECQGRAGRKPTKSRELGSTRIP